MHKILFYLVTLFIFQSSLFAQNLVDQVSHEICACLEESKVTSPEQMNPCIEKSFIKELANILEYYNAETMDDVDFENFGNEIGGKLIKNCDYMLPYFSDPVDKNDESLIVEENLDCTDLKDGEFFYTQMNIATNLPDTTYVTIKNTMFMERMNGGKTYSMLDIQWKENCAFDLIFKDSNDPIKKNLSEIGDRYNYQLTSTTPNSFKLKMDWRGLNYTFELFQLD